MAGKGVYNYNNPNAFWELTLPDWAIAFRYENLLSAEYGTTVAMRLDGVEVATGNNASGSEDLFGLVALPPGTNRKLR